VKKGYELLAHTADIGVIARGRDMKEAFVNAACGLFSIIAEPHGVQAKDRIPLEVTAPDREALLVNWLNELIYLSSTREMLFSNFDISSLSDTELKATVGGEKIDRSRHRLIREVKATTYHKLDVEQDADGWRVQVIFDI
jgi:SHS2 domain-containing protein